MAVLNPWQKINRVLPGQPFGDGRDGDLTISTNTTQSLTIQSCSGASGGATLTIASGAFTNGDVVIIKQERGTGAGYWEVNRVLSGGGSTTLTMVTNLYYTYTDSGASQAQIMKLPMYTRIYLESLTQWTSANWNENTGGVLLGASTGQIVIVGTVALSGSNNAVEGKGYGGGAGRTEASGGNGGSQGEGNAGAGTESSSANGSGGGAGMSTSGFGRMSGGGGGYGSAGENGGGLDNGTYGLGGGTLGSSDLTTISFGGAGGGGMVTNGGGEIAGGGGTSGGSGMFFAKDIQIFGSVAINGGNGGDGNQDGGGAGGGGSGGSLLLVCNTATLGSGLITATGGTGGNTANGSGKGGNGGSGRIAVHHSGTITGTSNPTLVDVSDNSIFETNGAGFFFL